MCNILSRAKIIKKVAANPYSYYDYAVKNDERPDKIANGYYGSPFYSWIVYLSNRIIDPYYGWLLDNDTFQEFIIEKYGSLPNADRQVVGWRVNWDIDFSIMSAANWANLPNSNQKYWKPINGVNFAITGYDRAQLNWQVFTNYFQQIYLNSNVSSISVGDLISTQLQNNIVSTAQVYSVQPSTNSIITIHNQGNLGSLLQYSVLTPANVINGEVLNASNSTANASFVLVSSNNTVLIASFNGSYPVGNVTITGAQSAQTVLTNNIAPLVSMVSDDTIGNSYFVMNNSNTIATCIPVGEIAYWEPWLASEFEDEKNSAKKNIKLLNSSYTTQTLMNLKNLMNP